MRTDTDLLGHVREGYSWMDENGYEPLVKSVVGFGLLAVLPYLIKVSVLGFRLATFLSVNILIITLVWAYAGQAWNILSGFTGYFSFGHAAFFGLGAYTTVKLIYVYGLNPWLGMVAGGIVAALVGLFIGYLSFRYNLRGHYFALATFAFAMLLQVTVRNLKELGGAGGFYRPPPRAYNANFGVIAMQFENPLPYYYVILVFLVIVTAVAWGIKNSQIGLYLFAIRENEDAAASLGISIFWYKMFAIGVSAFFTAWAGTFWAMYVSLIRPSTVFGLSRNVEILLPAVIGGLGTISGAIIGAFVIFPLSEFLRISFTQVPGLGDLVYGIALVLIALLLPGGVLSLPSRIRDYVGNDTTDDNSENGDIDETEPESEPPDGNERKDG